MVTITRSIDSTMHSRCRMSKKSCSFIYCDSLNRYEQDFFDIQYIQGSDSEYSHPYIDPTLYTNSVTASKNSKPDFSLEKKRIKVNPDPGLWFLRSACALKNYQNNGNWFHFRATDAVTKCFI